MAKKNFYAVRKGKEPGIFETWEACRASVGGYPGADYKGFQTLEEARAYLAAGEESPAASGKTQPQGVGSQAESGKIQPQGVGTRAASGKIQPQGSGTRAASGKTQPQGVGTRAASGKIQPPDQMIAYVDGSFDEKIGKYSFGCVMLLPDGEIVRESGSGNNPESAALRNVTGEMLGAMFAVKWGCVNGYPAIRLCYDYMGIEMWATGGWKAKNSLTRKYAAFMREHRKWIAVEFRKIAAHTGDKYNEEADKLAKAALLEGSGIPKIRKKDVGRV